MVLYLPIKLVSTPVLLHASLCKCEPFHGFSRYGGGIFKDGSTRHLFARRNTQHPNNCGELVVQSHCSQNSNCSWCSSEDLDDMCFTKSEASRLPQQLYTCR